MRRYFIHPSSFGQKSAKKKGGAASFGRAVSDCQKNLSERFGGPQVRNLNLRGER